MKEYLVLNTGAQMPIVGLGTWNAAPDRVGSAIEYALSECGYRHIDCAAVYHNEKEIGESLETIFAKEAIKREGVFVTSKLWSTNHARENVAKACKETLRDLKLDYLDLYLIHWGIAITHGTHDEPLDQKGYVITEKIPLQETWEAMEELVRQGFVKAIGIANFTAPMLLDLLSYAKVQPAVNQIELHPYLGQESLVDFCHYKNIAVTAYSPLGSFGDSKQRGLPCVLEDTIVEEIAQGYGKTPAQVLIRWAIQRNTIAIPKSIEPEHIKSNIEVFDFELSGDEMNSLKSLDRNLRYVDAAEWWKLPYF